MKQVGSILRWCCGGVLGVLLMISAVEAAAQTTGSCAEAEAEAYLDVGNVRARIFNDSALFWKGAPHVYYVPKTDSVSAMFTSSIWLGGYAGDALRVAAARYFRWQFWPGPLDDQGNPPADCAPYDRLWEITRDDLNTYALTRQPTDNLRHWPWQLGAPVLDGDGDPDNYNLDGGDRPALLGDQMLWWVMNDAGNLHEETGSPPIGMEVHASAFAFYRPGSYVNDVTFYRYVLHYKGQKPLDDAYVGFFADNDMGYPWDDYVASDTILGLGYTYNADEDDEDGYGTPPPAVGYVILRGPLARCRRCPASCRRCRTGPTT